MRIATCKKVKTWLLSALIFLAAALCAVLCLQFNAPMQTHAEEATVNRTLQSGEYQTNGASMRVFKQTPSGNFEETEDKGIRFHVEMGSGYKYGTTTLFVEEETNKNERGSWVIAEGFKTYTLILPSRLLPTGEDLTVNTPKVMKLDTTEYWYTDKNGNVESVAYLYDIPAKWYTDTFSFKGIICDSNDNVLVETETSERCLSYVAKMSYKDTVNPDTVTWGTADRDDKAAPLIKEFVPTYNITYIMADQTEIKEEVLWGDKPVAVPSFETPEEGHIEYTQSWFDQENHVEFNLDTVMDWTENKTFNLVQASAADFNLTGVADYNNFTVGDVLYSGVKLYATLDPNQIYTADEITNGTDKMVEVSTSAANFVLKGNGSFSGIQGVWAMLEGAGGGAQMRLIVAFDSTNMVSGDKIAIKEGAAFYANGSMYVLSQEYVIDYAEVNDKEDYGVFLGYLYNSDIKEVTNWTEPTDETRKRIRVEFRKDVFINSDFTIVYDGELPAGYTYPLYVHCEQGGGETAITKGYYHWNNGEHTILELEGFGHHGDEILYGVPGLKIVQNGGYFIYQDAIQWENDGNGRWVEGKEKGTFGANSFEIIGRHATDTTEARFTTNGNTTLTEGGMTDRWFDEVYTLKVENMSTEPYAVFVTNPNGTITPLNDFRYHGQSTGSGYNHILGFAGYEGTVAGETITILGGSRFWYGSEYYTAAETIIFYYNGTNWIVNTDGTANKELTMDNFIGKNYNYLEGENKLRMHLVEDASLFNGGSGILTLESGSIKVNGRAYTKFRYYGQYVDTNSGLTKYHMIFEIIGDTLAPIGQTAFGDTLVIEAGTRVWIGIEGGASAQPYCVEFPETLEWIYVGKGMRDGSGNLMSYEWVRADNNTNIKHTDITYIRNAPDSSADVRLTLAEGILTDDFYGYMVMETEKGVPVVNGVEKPDLAFSYGQGNRLFGIRGGDLGTKLGDYVIIPKGSVWWSPQGSFTFVEDVYGIWNPWGEWCYGFNLEDLISEISTQDIAQVMNSGSDEIRLQIPRGISDTYYGPIAVKGDAYVEKVDGTVVSCGLAYWYSGAGYVADHTLIGMRAVGFSGAQNGDTLTIKAGTKFVFPSTSGISGYHVFDEDVVYIYQNGNWRSSEGWKVTFNFANATVAVDGKAINSGVAVSMYDGTQKISVTPANGYSIVGVDGAVNNMDGTYSIKVSSNMTVNVVAKQSIKLGANAISAIGEYAEGSLTGVRINLDEAAYADLNNIKGVSNYGMSMNGATSIVLNGASASFAANTTYSYFGVGADSLLEMRFDTANLKAGDKVTIKAGTVFNHANMEYAIEFTEDIIGVWVGTKWVSISNATKAGEIDWDGLVHIASYSDPGTYTVRLYLPNELFNGGTGVLYVEGNATLNGTKYTGVWRYHGSGHKILEVSEWEYKKDDVLVIPAGTKIYLGSSYYEVTKTLTATCSADGAGGAWPWQVS